MSLAQRLEEAASALPREADAIRPANGDPLALLHGLEPQAAARVLAWLLEHAPEEAEELAEVWLGEAEGASALAALDGSSLPKDGRKVLRRLLHRARSSGLAVPTAVAKAAPRVARLPKVEAPIDEAYVAPFDPRGARLVYLVESTPRGGARVFEALLDGARGLVDFQVYRAGRSAVRSFVRDVTGRARYGATTAEPAQVRALLAVHVARHPADRPLPRAFGEWRGRLLSGADASATPGAAVRAALADDASHSADVDALLARVRTGELGPWPTNDRARLEAAAQSLRDAAKEADRDAALARALDVAAAAVYGPEDRALCAERLDEAAYLYWRGDEVALARAALQVAEELRDVADTSIHAFVRLATERLLAPLIEELRASGDPSQEAVPNQAE